ncbi:aldo/keto reductase/Endoribonuclease L-PSP [Microsporum canis CBS 113480]|uniref:Aldo/keto reductase/Endoribonuclease L-PSP n=1 Tax=Arthroderma otae (strain ATCC MYA-4605 / CBS 113480) TaxID=554155 RepID=C5FYI4_ARTOC|nr:aldo/keto reductase/Endoribonuclease L-PSP [Microsporum canis CBS 113480]EEQ34582.1 aldo/keto reductase/Endoribonuclease L-PSP [Microsporum canis CBS 113480]
MDDVLISNLPPVYLRSVLRTLLSHNPANQKPFVEHIRSRLQESPPALTEATELFPSADTVSPACVEYIGLTRCLFSSKLAEEAIGYSYCAEAKLLSRFERAERQVRDTFQLLFLESAQTTARVGHSQACLHVSLPVDSPVETFTMGGRQLPRLFNGLWQLSSPAFGAGSSEQQQKSLIRLVQRGFIAADMADHYGDAELVYGDFRNRLPEGMKDKVYAATKWCVFKPIGTAVTAEYVLSAVKERYRRLGGRVDLLQFHWYDYEAKEYLDILHHLVCITHSHPELVSSIGLCNFDVEHTEEVCKYLLDKTGQVGITSNQVQFSLIDTRPLRGMTQTCEKYGLKLLTYGSLRKYLDMIHRWGTWTEFQALMGELSLLAAKYKVDIADVASSWVLQQPTVGAILVGTRLGLSDRCADSLKVSGWALSEAEVMAIDIHARGREGQKTDAVFAKIGDCGQEYRNMRA